MQISRYWQTAGEVSLDVGLVVLSAFVVAHDVQKLCTPFIETFQYHPQKSSKRDQVIETFQYHPQKSSKRDQDSRMWAITSLTLATAIGVISVNRLMKTCSSIF